MMKLPANKHKAHLGPQFAYQAHNVSWNPAELKEQESRSACQRPAIISPVHLSSAPYEQIQPWHFPCINHFVRSEFMNKPIGSFIVTADFILFFFHISIYPLINTVVQVQGRDSINKLPVTVANEILSSHSVKKGLMEVNKSPLCSPVTVWRLKQELHHHYENTLFINNRGRYTLLIKTNIIKKMISWK